MTSTDRAAVTIKEDSPMEHPPVTDLAELPPMLTVPQAARVLGIGRTLAYELVRTDAWPTPVIRAGKLIKIPTVPLLELLATGRLPGTDVA